MKTGGLESTTVKPDCSLRIMLSWMNESLIVTIGGSRKAERSQWHRAISLINSLLSGRIQKERFHSASLA